MIADPRSLIVLAGRACGVLLQICRTLSERDSCRREGTPLPSVQLHARSGFRHGLPRQPAAY